MEEDTSLAQKKRCEIAFERARQEIGALCERAKNGEIILAYLDEAGFSCIHPNRSAWTKIGEQHLIPAIRGKRVNVLASLMSTGQLEDFIFSGSMNSKLFIDFVKSVSDKYEKHVVFILDNAKIHKSKEVLDFLEESKEKNFSLYYLPTYSPELNRIEKFWHTVKHRWMDVRCRKTSEVEDTLCDIFENFGCKFKFDFYEKKFN